MLDQIIHVLGRLPALGGLSSHSVDAEMVVRRIPSNLEHLLDLHDDP
jgi:hypothetical protein